MMNGFAPRGAVFSNDQDGAGSARGMRGGTANSGRADRLKPPLPNAFGYTVRDACRMGGFGRTSLYKMAKDGRLVLLKAAGRTLVSGDSLRTLLAVVLK